MAAGQGFKTFTTGEVLTAGDVNGYLMQGINVFTNATARDAAITAPAEGQFAFTKDNNSLWYYDGAAWVASGATGDIEGVTAGVGISGGGTSGTVTVTNSMATAIDAKGDLVPGTGADTFSRLPVGSNGTVLTADSAETTGLKWATPSGSTLNTSLITNGTITSGTSLTLSSLTSYDQLFLGLSGLNSSANGSRLRILINGVTSGVYAIMVLENRLGSTNAGSSFIGGNQSAFYSGNNYGFKNNTANGTLLSLTNCKSASGFTNVAIDSTFEHFNTTDRVIVTAKNVFGSNATVSSITIDWEDGNTFSAGTYRLYGA